jgi:hypothetical protein
LVRIRCSDNHFFQAYLAIVCSRRYSSRYSSFIAWGGFWDIWCFDGLFFCG